jgi:hypothetical protein
VARLVEKTERLVVANQSDGEEVLVVVVEAMGEETVASSTVMFMATLAGMAEMVVVVDVSQRLKITGNLVLN